MFKVICINNKPITRASNIDIDRLIEGGTYTVIQGTCGPFGNIGYILKEVETSNPLGFAAKRFIPLSYIDETEMERNYKTEKA